MGPDPSAAVARTRAMDHADQAGLIGGELAQQGDSAALARAVHQHHGRVSQGIPQTTGPAPGWVSAQSTAESRPLPGSCGVGWQ